MRRDLTWMLENAIEEAPGTRHAVLLSADGLLMASATNDAEQFTTDDAETVAAAMSGIQSLSRTLADFVGRDATQRAWRQSVHEFDHGWAFLMQAGENAYLGVSAAPDADLQDITFRMQQLVAQLGKVLTSPTRENADAS